MHAANSEDVIRASLMKWKKNAEMIKCEENVKTIRDYIRKQNKKIYSRARANWIKLYTALAPHLLNKACKLYVFNRIMRRLYARRVMDALRFKNMRGKLLNILIKLLGKLDTNNKEDLLRRKLLLWKLITKKIGEQELEAIKTIQNYGRRYLESLINKRAIAKQQILIKLLQRCLANSELALPANFYKWNMIVKKMFMLEQAGIIQNYMKKLMTKITKGQENSLNALVNCILKKREDHIRSAFDAIRGTGNDNVLKKLFPLTDGLLRRKLRTALQDWHNIASKMSDIKEKLMKYLRKILVCKDSNRL